MHHVFTPLMTYSSPSRVADVVTAPLSEPKSGSVTATAGITSPLASLGSHSCFCASVAPCNSARTRISGRVTSEPPTPSEPRESSSVATTMARSSPSPPAEKPPYCSGTVRPNVPSAARPAMTSSGMSSLVRWTCSATGRISCSAKRRKVSWTIS